MDSQLETQIKERFAALPEDVQRAIQSNDLEEQLRQIGEAHQLHIDQMGFLGDEVRLIMLGFTDPNEFASTLTEQTHIPVEEANKIAEEVVEKIFTPIRESMKHFMEEDELDEKVDTIAIPPQAPLKIENKDLPVPDRPMKSIMPVAEKILTQPTATPQIPANPTSPRPYKSDPYLEPTE